MHRFNSLFLNLIVVVGLAIGTVPLGLSSSTSQSSLGTVSASVAAAPALASGHGKHKHKKKHNDRQRSRKHKDRKQNRQRHKNRQQEQPVELPTSKLPDTDTVDPGVDNGPISAKDHYIVLLKSGNEDALSATSAITAGKAGVEPTFVYKHVFDGFAAVIPPDQLDAVRKDPRVEAVVPDRVVTKFDIPTGVNRIDADENTTADIDGSDEQVDVDVAVLDTAGKSTHPDLNQHAWANCTPSHNNFDDDGHGTHVSGTIGALDDGPNFNGIDVVGVAPGARLWNIRVLVNGSGLDSWIICGLDLVAQYATPQPDGLGDIEVANMSLGGDAPFLDDVCGDLSPVDPEHEAICDVVAAGVTMVVAAGNETDDAAFYTPASFDEVITVAALADSDGQGPPASSTQTSWGPDESLAEFSNFGADVDIAAPGVDILSTVPTGSCDGCDPDGYTDDYSGTSMASPHVAGAAALYLATHPGTSPADVRTALIDLSEPENLSNSLGDSFNGGIVNVADPGFSDASAARAESGPSASSSGHKTTRKHAHKKNQHQAKGKHKR